MVRTNFFNFIHRRSIYLCIYRDLLGECVCYIIYCLCPALTCTTLWANSAENSADGKLTIFLLIFSRKGLDILCKLCPMETICMKYPFFFLGKIKIKMSKKKRLLEMLTSMLYVKLPRWDPMTHLPAMPTVKVALQVLAFFKKKISGSFRFHAYLYIAHGGICIKIIDLTYMTPVTFRVSVHFALSNLPLTCTQMIGATDFDSYYYPASFCNILTIADH